MELVDYSALTEHDHETIISEAPPCPDCFGKDGLVLGVVSSGEEFGELVVLCMDCHLEPPNER